MMNLKENLPRFSNLDIAQFPKKLEQMLQQHLEKITTLLKNSTFNWSNLMQPLDIMADELEQYWSPIAHLHAVTNTPALRDCYQACLPQLTAYSSAISQNKALYEAIQSIDITALDATQKKIIQDQSRDFKLSGVHLPPEQKKRFEVINLRLATLSNQFDNHVLDATQAFQYLVTDEKRLQGLPTHTIEQARQLAIEKNQSGWLLTLETPCYIAIMTHADNRALRETFYQAYATRASDQGPHAGQYDNTAIIEETLALRHEKAQITGFAHYADRSIATKMANTSQEVLSFLEQLHERSYAQAKQEFADLERFSKTVGHTEKLEPWDIAYYSEKKKQQEFSISEEMLRPYFPLPQVMTGLFEIIQRLYGMKVSVLSDVDTWHADVLVYQIHDENNTLRGCLYMDLFARPNKRGGAWMDSCRSRYRLPDDQIQTPIAFLTCNFTNPVGNAPAILSPEEVTTLFHEFGHCLHHLLTQVDYLSASGIGGVEWDAVELPSQFFENWCWVEESVHLLSSHVDTKEPIPTHLMTQMLAAKNFQSAMQLARQLEFSLFDFRIHLEHNPQQPEQFKTIVADVRKKVSVVPFVDYNRFAHSFSHIFAGGYAAGYYSYKWAEVLSSDAFGRFLEEGVLNPQTGRDFLHCILEVGSSQTAAAAYQHFRGRMPSIDALLKQDGIIK